MLCCRRGEPGFAWPVAQPDVPPLSLFHFSYPKNTQPLPPLLAPAERVGSFRVRSDAGQGAGDDDTEGLRQWIDSAVDVGVPWLSPLVPWQPGSAAAVQARIDAATAAEAATEAIADATAQLRRLALADRRPAWQPQKVKHEGGSRDGKVGKAAKVVQPPVRPPAPPPPPPLGHEAVALLAELNLHSSRGGPRHICIQGKLENSRRNYTAAFQAIRCLLGGRVGKKQAQGWLAAGPGCELLISRDGPPCF